MDAKTLRKLQLTQLEILKTVDSFCRENKIMYSLYAGTLIGAVRHNGFIPWDDDIDICMKRKEYNRFIKLWNQHPPKGYILQNKENTPGYTQSSTKIRKENTTFIQAVDTPRLYHTGIFIDIFPADKMPNKGIKRILFKINCIFYQLYTKEYIPKASNLAGKLIAVLALKMVPKRKRKRVRSILFSHINRYNDDDSLSTVFIGTIASINMPLPNNLLDEFVELKFEDNNFLCMKEWDTYLSTEYGDYMTPPPLEERVGIHDIQIIDFECDYGEYIQKRGITD